jgi:hypothetical protein
MKKQIEAQGRATRLKKWRENAERQRLMLED